MAMITDSVSHTESVITDNGIMVLDPTWMIFHYYAVDIKIMK